MEFNKPTEHINKLLQNIAKSKAYVKHIVLPDLHYKPQMEAPSSTAISTGKYIVPSLASAAINDGMSIIKLPFIKKDLSDEIIKDFFTEINLHASKNKLEMNKYSLSKEELLDVCLNGASAVVDKFDLDKKIIDSIELSGAINEELSVDDVKRLVPKALLKSKFGRAEFGLNFKGNHFLELQYINDVLDENYAKKFKVEKDDVMVMTHLGPGPFTGNLMRMYTNRKKLSLLHKTMFLFAKSYFHLLERKRKDLSIKQIIKYFFNPDTYQEFHIDTEIGKDFYKLIQIGTNYGYAYQLGTFTAVRDAVRVIQKKHNLIGDDAQLIWNVSHNSIYKDSIKGDNQFITRHNSVKIYDNKPTIIAGSFDMPSLIGICDKPGDNILLDTHDHGIGSLINRLKEEGKLNETEEISKRYYFIRGESTIEKIKPAKIYDLESIVEISEYFENESVLKPWFYVTPIATLKN
ncbi:RtcB family protein [bacterium]|nr:RtcB family protein [bacterium]